ncbi:sugar phosphate isomerase/epimerase family protein [Occultella gossypii]|uniref:Sugar phosphate isomerase/epimerase n=1 Tax=Occultella gossypii TaxID=2800820 RepID=A0ABS7SFZ8_9MICO|nr:sugar phosphate isomerase/epimerase [Occultella gossypii]MBZ2198188.1 sugar phosphate isomerase/epimerase [Occultella gossypii]
MPGAISVQLYSIRNAMAEDMPGALQRIADLGFENVELYGYVDRVDAHRDALAAAGLRAPSGHARLVVSDDVPGVLDASAALGMTTVIDPSIPEEQWATRELIEASAARLNEIAKQAADRGLEVGYHNHWWEVASVDGTPGLEIFAAALDDGVTLEVDTYWAEVGGVAAPGLLRRLGDKVTHIHVKDGPATRDTKAQLPAGQGVVPVAEILAAAPEALRVIEFDDFDGDVFDGLAQSLAWLKAQA